MGCFGGPSKNEQSLGNAEQNFSSQLMSNYATQFGDQSDILQSLNASLNPIISQGINQEGFSGPELAAMNTQAINSTGSAYQNAARALNGQLAGRGGDSGLESGVDQQIKESLASNAAGNLANQQLGITEANYAQGRANFDKALQHEEGIASLYDPTAYGGLATQANNSAFNEQNNVNQQNNQKNAEIAGGIAGLASSFLPGGSLGGLFGSGGAGSTSALAVPNSLPVNAGSFGGPS